jgi:hypothetical protein
VPSGKPTETNRIGSGQDVLGSTRRVEQMPVALLGDLIGLGGAEFRLPLLIAVVALYPHRAIRINLLISLEPFRLSWKHIRRL